MNASGSAPLAGSTLANAGSAGSADAARANYRVAASFRRTGERTVPTLKVTRLSDKRLIYPFGGSPDMPFFTDAQAAQQYAETYGWQLVDGDIAVPE